ncbi:MAG: hypothetical protein RL211_2115 [Pseudomonadota bacterium]|jgi:hypothetical protein
MLCIETASHVSELAALADSVSGEPVEFLLVPDCGVWAESCGMKIQNRSPRGLAVRRRTDSRAIVVLRENYEEGHIADQASALLVAGWADQSAEVRQPASFLRFLVLHELAHLVNHWGQEHEQDCNEWAFQKLGWS